MPENLIKLGICVISIFIHDPPFPNLNVFVHQKGLLFANSIPDASDQIEASGSGFVIPVVHEVEELLNYDEEKCEDSKDYIFDQCMRSLIQKVSTYHRDDKRFNKFFHEIIELSPSNLL